MQRIELKFLTENNSFIKNNIELFKLYPSRIINNFYFDTNNLDYHILSEEGITPRLKVRLRSYNNSNNMNLEIKYTFSNTRDKVSIKNFEYNKQNLIFALKENEIFDILRPTVKVSYKRKYFKCNYGRLTYDSNIIYQKINSKLLPISTKHYEFNKVIELKTYNLNIDKKSIFNFINISESRNSKYCNAIEKAYFQTN